MESKFLYKKLSAPISCQLEIGTSCDNNCIHCYNYWRKDNDTLSIRMTKEQAIDSISKLDQAGVLWIIITGGEPLLNFDTLVSTAKECQKRQIRVSLNTNLNIINEQMADKLREIGINKILTSVHGVGDEHDNITTHKGSFSKVMKGIKIAMKAGIHVSVNMVISKKNKGIVANVAKYISKLGINNFMATKAGCPPNCNDFTKIAVNKDEVNEYLNTLSELHSEYGFSFDILSSFPLCGIKNLDKVQFVGRRCMAGITTVTIGADGAIRPCNHSDIIYGNIFNDDFITSWNAMDEWRKGAFIPDTCKNCKLFGTCGGGCRIEAKTHNGDYCSMDPFSSPENVPECIKKLNLRNRSKKNMPEIINFKLVNDVKIRDENFGAVVIGHSSAILSKKGKSIFYQMQKDTIYDINNSNITWFNVDKKTFIWGLTQRGIITINN